MAKKKYYQRPDGLYEAIRVVNGKRKAFRGRTPHEVEQKMIAYQGEIARYRSAALGYYAEHGGTYIMPYDYSAGFEGYCKRHPIPAPLLDTSS